MQPGDVVSWRGVNRRETGEIRVIGNRGIIILLANGKAVVADISSLRKEEGNG